jgi:peptidoglycan/xylan/chitin deacetylase (PgdA/CDA1 family)
MRMLDAGLRNLRILMFHRIAQAGLDPWGLCVSPGRLFNFLDVLRKRFRIVALEEAAQLSDSRDALAITFDDGYSDNLFNAKPVLDALEIPATVFVTSGYADAVKEYWWDEVERIFLYPGALPETLDIDISGVAFHFDIGDSFEYTEEEAALYTDWRVTWDGRVAPTVRHELFLAVWNLLYGLRDSVRERVISYLFSWSGIERTIRSTHKPLDLAEAKALLANGLIRIGSHTITHSDLTILTRDEKIHELTESKQALEVLAGTSITSIAYPHGKYDEETLRCTFEAGYELGCGTGEIAYPDHLPTLQLPRTMILEHELEVPARVVQQLVVPLDAPVPI